MIALVNLVEVINFLFALIKAIFSDIVVIIIVTVANSTDKFKKNKNL
jgi:hypothetical protein